MIKNPKGSAIFIASPLSQLCDNPPVVLEVVDQCGHDATIYDEEAGAVLPVRKASSLLAFDISLDHMIKECPGKEAHPKHSRRISGKPGYMAVAPWKMATTLVKDFIALVKVGAHTFHALASHTYDVCWKCLKCRLGTKTEQEHTRAKRCRFGKNAETPDGGVPSQGKASHPPSARSFQYQGYSYK